MSSAFTDQPSEPDRGPHGLAILAFMGFGMLAGILFLSWLGTPRITPTVGQALTKVELVPLAFADKPLAEADLLGKVTLLHFWGTWCLPCRQEFPEFAKLTSELSAREGLQVISISSSEGPEYDLDGLAESTKKFLAEYESSVPTYADPAGLTRAQVGSMLADSALPYPCTMLLDREAIVRGVWLGYQPGTMEKVRVEVDKMLR